ncbi:MAG: hypothetical protein QXS57_02485 [Candidatus Caldarchaeum sp.]
MTELAEKVVECLKKLRDPVSGAPALFLESSVEVKDLGDGVVLILYVCRDPYSPRVLTFAEAAKALASKCEGVKRVIVEVRNHVLADLVNLRLNA